MVIKRLRRHGVDFSAKDEYEMTGLHLAAIKGNYDVVQYVLSVKSDLIFEKDKQVKFQELTYHCHSLPYSEWVGFTILPQPKFLVSHFY